MAEKESFFSRFFGNKKKEGCCCQLNIVKNERPNPCRKRATKPKKLAEKRIKNKNSAKTISDPLALFSKSFSKGSGIVAVGR